MLTDFFAMSSIYDFYHGKKYVRKLLFYRQDADIGKMHCEKWSWREMMQYLRYILKYSLRGNCATCCIEK